MPGITVTKKDILAPANGVSLLGLILTIIGIAHITSLIGVIVVGIGRCIDLLDGVVARRTHTSDLGALLDATSDKISIILLISVLWLHAYAPMWIIVYVLVQNAINILLSITAKYRGGQPAASR